MARWQQYPMYDVFFISYTEPNADSNWALLKNRIFHAKRIHGINGIANAHRACARASLTSMFYTVDGDTVVDDTWDFSFKPPVSDQDNLHLWYSRNPVNGLSYGYGGIKLWPRHVLLLFEGSWLDFTTSVGPMKVIPTTISTTHFNSSPFEAWKSAFRECIKLIRNTELDPNDVDSINRLSAWQHVYNDDTQHSDFCLLGAGDAVKDYSILAKSGSLSLINDFSWLYQRFLTATETHLIDRKTYLGIDDVDK